MATHVTDSLIFRDLYSTDAMRAVFEDRQLIQYWLDVEAALARVQARLAIVPPAAADEITRQAEAQKIDMEALRQGTNLVGYPILPLVRQLAALCNDEAAGYVHWGATTQDIMDTATVLQLRAALDNIDEALAELIDILSGLAERHKHTTMAGRTHGQHALPITFGFKVAVWVDELQRHGQRLQQMRPRLLRCQFSGAAGTLASLDGNGWQVHEALAKELGLHPARIAWHSARDTFAEFVGFCAMLTATLAKAANEVAVMQKTEVAEVEEPFTSGKGSSSTMPQKRNPILCETVIGIGHLTAHHVPTMLGAMRPEHERAMGEWHAEWDLLPHTSQLTAAALAHSQAIFDGLIVHADKMQQNLEQTNGQIVAEAVMMRLGQTLGRERAHELVYEACALALADGQNLYDILVEQDEVRNRVSPKELKQLLEPAQYVGLAPFYVDNVIRKPAAKPGGG